MDKNKKKIIIFIFILLILIAIIAIGLSFLIKEEEPNEPYSPTEPINPDDEVDYYNVNITELDDLPLYNSVNSTMNILYSNLNNISTNIFSDDYVTNNNISVENLSSMFASRSTDISFRVKDAYYGYKNNNYCFIFTGYTYLSGIDDLPKIDEYKYFIMHVNMNSYTYNIEIISQTEFDNIKKQMKYITYEVDNKSAKFKYQNLSEENLAKVYFNNFKTNLIANYDYIYNILEDSTKEKYFNTLASFQDYISNNISSINTLEFVSYKKGEKKYYITDNKQNLYIFSYNSVFDFTIDITFNEWVLTSNESS